MKRNLLIAACLITTSIFGQQTFQIPLDYVFATQGIDGPNNYANGGTIPSSYDGTSTLNWFSTANTAFQLQNGQHCTFAGNSTLQPTDNFSLVIRAKIDIDDVEAITNDGKAFTIWNNGPHGLFINSDGNGGFELLGSVKNGVGFGNQTVTLPYDGFLANAMNGWVTYYLMYEQNTTTNESKLYLSFNGSNSNDNATISTEPALADLMYDNPTNDFHIGANPNDQDLAFDGIVDYCYFYDYLLSSSDCSQFDANVCEKLTIGSTTLVPKEPYDANLTYDWCIVTNDGTGDAFTSTGATGYSFTPSASGTYMCKIGFGGMYTTYTEYATMTVSGVGLNEVAMDAFHIFPNPASSSFNVEDALGATVQLIDFSGKILNTLSNYQGESIDVSSLSKGVYVILISNSAKIRTVRFIKE